MTLLSNAVKCSGFIPSAIRRCYHVSSPLRKWPSVLRPATIKQRPQKKVKIWKRMTVWELGKSLKKDLDYVNEVLKPAFSTKIDRLSGQITDLSAIKGFLDKEKVDYSVMKTQVTRLDLEVLKQKIHKVKTPFSKNEVNRPPVVAIMGHVDHGKTTLLDALRNTNVVAREFGGITQHIGAFSYTLPCGKAITFIDTPGHAAFSAMRNRGASVTDIVVLVVAADDGVMEQTVESIKMAKNAGVNVIVAVNKIDMAPNNLASIKEQLLTEGIQAEDLGGDVQFVSISALKRINLDALIEAILVEAEMLALTGDPTAPVEGVIIESAVEKRGKIATIIVKRGTLCKRKILVAGPALARVRGMYDEDGRELSQVTLSQPAQVIGWQDLPAVGERVIEVESQKEANILLKEHKKEMLQRKLLESYVPLQEKAVQEKAEFTERKKEYSQLRIKGDIAGLKKYFAKKPTVKEDYGPQLNIIVKGDVDGSVDAILDVLGTYDCEKECKLDLIHFGVGQVTQSDLELAKTFNAIIYCFNLDFPQNLKEEISQNNIVIKFYNVIYEFIDDLKNELSERRPDIEEDDIIGTGEVLEKFTVTEGKKLKPVAGCCCLTGEFRMKAIFRVIHDDNIIFEGPIASLKHFKNEVNMVKKGDQCGIILENFTGTFTKGDKIVCLQKKLVRYPTSWNPGF